MALGVHVVSDLKSCDVQKLNSVSFITEMLKNAASAANATEIKTVVHKFNPQGITGVIVLAESHISIHTWPELGTACVDCFTCGDHTVPENAIQYIVDHLSADVEETFTCTRGRNHSFHEHGEELESTH